MSARISSKAEPPSAARNPSTTDLRIGGFVPLSSCDWPGELVATMFCQGCPWDCAYCHNAHLRPADASPATSWESILGFLQARVGLLDGVVFSGGEPTLQPDLPLAIQQVRALGFRIGLHTAGIYPDRLAAALPLIDWVGFDVKAPFEDYARTTGVPHSGERALRSLRHVISSGVAYEVRTTVLPALLDAAALHELARRLADTGVTHYAVQAAGAAAPLLADEVRTRFTSVTIR